MTEQTTHVTFTIDGKALTVPKGTTVYTACQQMGIDIPIFCYQDRMPPFGACRVCLVEVEKMPKLQSSCTLEAQEGMVVNTQSHMAMTGREEILEFLLINHPLDCPICDRGGECPLQDQAIKFGPGKSRFFEEKRHFTKHHPLGPVLMLDRERCIQCARCTRFGDLVSGDHALEFIDRGYKTEVGTPDGGPCKSKYIGNTIMICPVGALTSEVYRFRARPWDNHPTVSTCTLCPVGCSMILDSRDGEIVRTRSEENKDVNDIWLCDKGWFGYEFSSSTERLQTPYLRKGEALVPVSWDEAFSFIASKIQDAKKTNTIAALGGNCLTCEESYLFQKLMRNVIGTPHVDHRIGNDFEHAFEGMEISIGEIEHLSSALILGVDLTEEFPVIWLRLKQALNKGAKATFIGHYAPEISRYFENTILHSPRKEIETLKKQLEEMQNQKGAIFVGRQYLNSPDQYAIMELLFEFCTNNPGFSLNVLQGKGNSIGARYSGMHPDFLPLNEKCTMPGLNNLQVLEAAIKSGWSYLHIAGANLSEKLPSNLWNKARKNIGCLVVQDLFMTQTARQADVVLPTFSFVEKEGSFINVEGRVQKLQPGKDIPQNILSDGEIFIKIAEKLGSKLSVDTSFIAKLQQERVPLFRTHRATSPSTPFHDKELYATFAPVLFDQGVRMKHNAHLLQLAPKPYVRMHPLECEKRNIQNNQKITITKDNCSISAHVTFDTKIASNTIVIPLGFEDVKACELGPNLLNGQVVECTYGN